MTKPVWKFLLDNKMIVFTIISTLFIGYQAIQNNVRNSTIEAQLTELRLAQTHDRQTDFALRLTGMRKTAETTESAMREQYEHAQRIIEHCRTVRTCNLPNEIATVKPLPSYVPVAGLYLLEKEKLVNEH